MEKSESKKENSQENGITKKKEKEETACMLNLRVDTKENRKKSIEK